MAHELIPTAAELKLIQCAARGEVADYRSGDVAHDHPEVDRDCDEQRTLSSTIVQALILRTNPAWMLDQAGVRIAGARITGVLDLSGGEIGFPLSFESCRIEQPLRMSEAKIESITLRGSEVAGVEGRSLICRRDVILDSGFDSRGAIVLAGAQIGGDLVCRGSSFAKGLEAGGSGLTEAYF